jgi:death on curing protein
MKYLSVETVISIHEDVLKATGGKEGLSGDKSLESILHRIDNAITYDGVNDIYEIASFYAIVIARGHAFIDGNKRSALVAMIDFLDLNGITLNAPDKMEDIMVEIVENKRIDREWLATWIKSYCIHKN